MARPRKSTTKSTPVSAKSHKRQLSNGTPTTATPPTRASKRIKESAGNTPASATPKKSKYFEDPGSEDEEVEESSASEEFQESGNEYEEEQSSAVPSSSESESEEEFDSEEEEKKRKKNKAKARKSSLKRNSGGNGDGDDGEEGVAAGTDGKELWRPGVKTGLGPGKQVFIAKPKPRGDGGIKYVPTRIHPNTMAFLTDLRKNNDREWLKMHDPDYRQSWNDWTSFVDALTEKITEVDETIPELPPKDLVFRIYRDIRFSPDPTPYKTHFSAAWSRTGRKGPYACYYVQIKPGGHSFVGAGLWMPDSSPLALMREDINTKSRKIKRVLTDSGIRKHIFNGLANDEKKAVKAFAAQNSENALKTKPKGYEADNANIELLRLRNYTIGRKLTDEEVIGPHGLSRIVELIGAMVPFVTYLNSVVMPDEDASSSGDEKSDSGDDDAANT